MEVDNLSKCEESQYTINFQCKLICIGIVWSLEGLVLHHPSCRNLLWFSQKAGGKGRLCYCGNGYSGTSSLLPAGGHWMAFVVAVVPDSQQPVLSLSGWSLAIRTLATPDLSKVLHLLIAAGGSLYGEFVILNFWMGQQRFPGLGDQILKNQVPNEIQPLRLELDGLW